MRKLHKTCLPSAKTEKRQKSKTNELCRQAAAEPCTDKMITNAMPFERIYMPIAAKSQSLRKGTSTTTDGPCNKHRQIAIAYLATTASQFALLNAQIEKLTNFSTTD
jgi:hypothetical protein